jgi:hypothetical protein
MASSDDGSVSNVSIGNGANVGVNVRQFWTPDDRQKWIETAINSEHSGGDCDGYRFSVMPKQTATEAVAVPLDEKKEKERDDVLKATDALANVLYKKDPRYRILSIGFYINLMERVRVNQYVGPHLWRNLLILVKGSNAQSLLVPHLDLGFSDLDIIIYINPLCAPEIFESIRKSMHIILVQMISQYKKTLDHMLFLSNPNEIVRNVWGIPTEVIEQFKKDHIAEMESVGLISVFKDNKLRNMASRNSIVLMDSVAQKDMVVRVEVPHFNMCEKIPLRKTPIFCSYNETIHDGDKNRDFNLYRLKFNSMVETDVDGGNSKMHRVQADFIDITIPLQSDAELRDNWLYGRFTTVFDPPCNYFITVPDLNTCVYDLYKMLNVYDCPEHKREKREAKYKLLTQEIGRFGLSPETWIVDRLGAFRL